MAFNTVEIPIDEILDTDFYPEVATKSNANFALVKDQIEALLNGFEIDIAAGKIGVDTPVNTIRVKNLIVENGTVLFTKTGPSQTLFSVIIDGSNESLMNVDKLVADTSLTSAALTVTGASSTQTLTVSDDATFSKSSSFVFSQAEDYEETQVALTYDSGWAVGTVNLTSASRRNIFLTLTINGELLIYNPGTSSWNGSLNGIKLYVKVDGTAPVEKGQQFNLFLAKILSGTTQIFQSWTTFANSNTKFVYLYPDTTTGQSVAFGNNNPGANPNIKFSNNPLDSFIGLYATVLSDSSDNNGVTTNRFIIIGDRNMNYV